MKRLPVILVSLAILMLVKPPASYSCTALCIKGDAGYVAAFNHDWVIEDAFILINKPNVEKKALSYYDDFPKDSIAKWVSKHGSISITQYGQGLTSSGMNEAGLFAACLSLIGVML